MNDIKELVKIVESRDRITLVQATLPVKKTALAPQMSAATIDYHFDHLYKGYVDRYNRKEGDDSFNEAGAFLHDLFFSELQTPSGSNKPYGAAEALINRRYGSYAAFQEKFAEEAMKVQGSGWVYMSRKGDIKTIVNHGIRKDIALLVDWWEHAWALDYQADKAKYLKNFWSLINWEVVSRRIYAGA
jgi:Fe-Mn family superoxide dismutase